VNITEFWRRWHISLSSWLRDYLYVSLGGNRRGTRRTYWNLMSTMLIGGLWHGANWTYVVWGGLHGLYLAAHRALVRERRADAAPPGRTAIALGVAATNLLIAGTLIVFRSSDLEAAGRYFVGMAPLLSSGRDALLALCALALHLAIVLAIDLPARATGIDEATEALPAWARSLTFAVMGYCVWTAWPSDYSPFIYFQF